MDARLRSTKLYEEAMRRVAREFPEAATHEAVRASVYGVACLLAEANPKAGARTRAEKPPAKLLAKDVFERMRRELPGFVLYEPFDKGWMSLLQRNIGVVDWPPETVDKLVEWCRTGRGSTFFKHKPAHFGVVAQHFRAWATEALSGEDRSLDNEQRDQVRLLRVPQGR